MRNENVRYPELSPQFIHFEHGTIQDKRVIFEGLGYNFSLKDGELTIDARKPFTFIEKLGKDGTEELAGLEPEELLVTKRKNGALGPVRSTWLPGQDSNL